MPSLYPRKKSTTKKVCAICQKNKHLHHFHITKWDAHTKIQRHSYCKPCLQQYMADRYRYLTK